MKTLYIIAFLLLIARPCNCQTASGSPKLNSSDSIYTFVEQNPQFPGGDGELMRFLQKNLQYPSDKKDDEIVCGRIAVRFIIDVDGSVKDPKMVKACEPRLDAELIRVVNLLPKFKPGYQNGKPVKVYFTLPISCIKLQ